MGTANVNTHTCAHAHAHMHLRYLCTIASDTAHTYFGEHSVTMRVGTGWSNNEALLGMWGAAVVQCAYALKHLCCVAAHARHTPHALKAWLF